LKIEAHPTSLRPDGAWLGDEVQIEGKKETAASPQRRRDDAENTQRVERYAVSAFPLRLLRVCGGEMYLPFHSISI
jgi:hypothetical protein